MPTFKTIKKQLTKMPYLVADGYSGEVRLVSETNHFKIITQPHNLFSSQTILNANQVIDDFAGVTGDVEREFMLKEIVKIAKCPYSQVYHWMMVKVLKPSIHGREGSGRGKNVIFSWPDAFVAGILGSLRINGCRLEMLAKVQPLLFTKTKNKTVKIGISSRDTLCALQAEVDNERKRREKKRIKSVKEKEKEHDS